MPTRTSLAVLAVAAATAFALDETCVTDLDSDDTEFLLQMSFNILAMQVGFASVEAGAVSPRNKLNILFKNVCDLLAGGFGFYLVGWPLCFGGGVSPNGWIGWGDFLLEGSRSLPMFIFQMSFAATASTIDSGCVCERMLFSSYLILSTITTSIVFPLAAHWVWVENGWLQRLGFVDLAGGAVVHLLGAVSGLVCAVVLGPRLNAFSKDHIERLWPKRRLGWPDIREAYLEHMHQDRQAKAREKHARSTVSSRGTALSTGSARAGSSRPLGAPSITPSSAVLKSTAPSVSGVVLVSKGAGTASQASNLDSRGARSGPESSVAGPPSFAASLPAGAKVFPRRIATDRMADIPTPPAHASQSSLGSPMTPTPTPTADDVLLPSSAPRLSDNGSAEPDIEDGRASPAFSTAPRLRVDGEGRRMRRSGTKPQLQTRSRSILRSGSFMGLGRFAGSFLGRPQSPSASDSENELAEVEGIIRARARLDELMDGANAPHDEVSLLFGAMSLLLSWLSFNTASVGTMQGGMHAVAAHVTVVTMFGACAGGLAGLLAARYVIRGHFAAGELANGILGGLVGVTAGAHVFPFWSAWIVGAVGGLLACFWPYVMLRLRIDDPVCAVSVHGPPAFFGVLAVAIFARPTDPCSATTEAGLVYGGSMRFFGIQLLGCLVIVVWATLSTLLVLGCLHMTLGLRVTEDEERVGMDVVEHMVLEDIALLDLQESQVRIVSSLSSDGDRKTASESPPPIQRTSLTKPRASIPTRFNATNSVTVPNGLGGKGRSVIVKHRTGSYVRATPAEVRQTIQQSHDVLHTSFGELRDASGDEL